MKDLFKDELDRIQTEAARTFISLVAFIVELNIFVFVPVRTGTSFLMLYLASVFTAISLLTRQLTYTLRISTINENISVFKMVVAYYSSVASNVFFHAQIGALLLAITYI